MEQNKYGKIAIVALIIASILSAAVLGASSFLFLGHESAELFVIVMSLLGLIVIFINLFIAFKVYKGNFKCIKVAFWLYVVQILSIEALNFSFYFSLGFTLLLSWSIGSVTVTLNLFAIFMSVLLYKVMKNVGET
jgi:hypothetical protein